uniref:Ig-like domain-containing protein n=1 Tax=Oncorhynchus kisutch TaxID=8019 RepID=A0A8C7MJC0_ONCKI
FSLQPRLNVAVIYLSFFSGCRAEENVTQPTEDVMVVEGQRTKLSCTFDTTDLSPYLFWYKQQPNGNPVFLQSKYTFGVKETVNEFKGRFHARLNVTAKSFPLTIQRLQLSDSAVYYCALKPTVTAGYTVPLQKL